MAKRVSRPGFIGAVEDAVDAVKDYAGYGKGSVTGNANEDKQLADESTASNAGKQAQSSDSSNNY